MRGGSSVCAAAMGELDLGGFLLLRTRGDQDPVDAQLVHVW